MWRDRTLSMQCSCPQRRFRSWPSHATLLFIRSILYALSKVSNPADLQQLHNCGGVRFHLPSPPIFTRPFNSLYSSLRIRLSTVLSSFANSSDVIGLWLSNSRMSSASMVAILKRNPADSGTPLHPRQTAGPIRPCWSEAEVVLEMAVKGLRYFPIYPVSSPKNENRAE